MMLVVGVSDRLLELVCHLVWVGIRVELIVIGGDEEIRAWIGAAYEVLQIGYGCPATERRPEYDKRLMIASDPLNRADVAVHHVAQSQQQKEHPGHSNGLRNPPNRHGAPCAMSAGPDRLGSAAAHARHRSQTNP